MNIQSQIKKAVAARDIKQKESQLEIEQSIAEYHTKIDSYQEYVKPIVDKVENAIKEFELAPEFYELFPRQHTVCTPTIRDSFYKPEFRTQFTNNSAEFHSIIESTPSVDHNEQYMLVIDFKRKPHLYIDEFVECNLYIYEIGSQSDKYGDYTYTLVSETHISDNSLDDPDLVGKLTNFLVNFIVTQNSDLEDSLQSLELGHGTLLWK